MILPRLRAGTRELHVRLEKTVDLPRRLSSLEAYRALLEDFYGLYQPLEARLAAHSQLSDSGLATSRLQKHALLEADLNALGCSVEAIRSIRKCDRLPVFTDVFSAAGSLYVLEGATLGGQIVRREVDQRLGLSDQQGCLFFSSYGARVKEMWDGFCRELTALATDDDGHGESILKGACETFVRFEEWMR
jgi:heme oxygenase